MATRHQRRNPAAGFTLVELLVVVGIIVVLLAVAIPALRLTMEDSRIREAARIVSAYFVAAQSRAVETGRPVGVWIERDPNDPNQALSLFTAEVPLPYSGDFVGAGAVVLAQPGPDGEWGVAGVDDDGNGIIDDPYEIGLPDVASTNDVLGPVDGPDGQPGRAGVDDDGDGTVDNLSERGRWDSDDNYATFSTASSSPSLSLPGLVQAGDHIRFGNQGPLYRIEAVVTTPQLIVFFSHPSLPPPSRSGGPVAYEILRQPIRSSAGSVELPKGTVIDLDASGIGGIGTEFDSDTDGDGTPDTTAPIIILFSPRGSVDQIIIPGVVAGTPIAPIHVLIGRIDNTSAVDDSPENNLNDDRNIWVSIGHATGSVTSSAMNPSAALTGLVKILEARELARQAQTMKGS